VLELSRRVLAAPTVGPLVALVLAMAFFSFKSDRFLDAQNLSLVLQQVMVVGVLAIGQTLVILTAGIDLSVGTVMALGQIVMTKMVVANGVSPLLAIAVGILTCVAFGALNGGLVTLVRLPAFIVTLGTLNIAFALTHIISNDLTFSGLPSELLFFGRTFTLGHANFTYGVVCMLVLYALVWFALTQTAGGRHVYAVGDNREAARLTGVNTSRVLLSVYALAGLMSGIAALLLVARTELGDPNAGQTTENLDSITAVVLGGTSLFGGRGSIIGTLIGAVIVGVFRNGLTLIGVEVIYQYLVTGTLVILAVSVDQLTHRRPV
jgi:fructose transport system permease protein